MGSGESFDARTAKSYAESLAAHSKNTIGTVTEGNPIGTTCGFYNPSKVYQKRGSEAQPGMRIVYIIKMARRLHTTFKGAVLRKEFPEVKRVEDIGELVDIEEMARKDFEDLLLDAVPDNWEDAYDDEDIDVSGDQSCDGDDWDSDGSSSVSSSISLEEEEEEDDDESLGEKFSELDTLDDQDAETDPSVDSTADALDTALSSVFTLSERQTREIKASVSLVDTICGEFTPKLVNLINDFVESQLFVIDGDSLVLEILSSPGLDFKHGGQYLHFIYLVEQFLQYFKERDGLFHIVFFKCMESVWLKTPSMLLARQMVILHLQKNTEVKVLTEFDNWFGGEWKEYLDGNHPAFMMVADGDTKACFGEDNVLARFLYQSLAVHTIFQRINIAFSSQITHTVTKLFGYYVASYSKHRFRPHFQKYMKRIIAVQNLVVGILKDDGKVSPQCAQTGRKEIIDLLQACPIEFRQHTGYSMRTILTMMACSDALRERCNSPQKPSADKQDGHGFVGRQISVNYDLAYVYFVHCLLLGSLPLEYRAQNLSEEITNRMNSEHQESLEQFLQSVQRSLYAGLVCIQDVAEDECNEVLPTERQSIADIMDGRLFYRLLLQLYESDKLTDIWRTGIALPEELNDLCKKLWRVIISGVNGAHVDTDTTAPTQTLAEPAESAIGRGDEHGQGSSFVPASEGLIPVNCELVRKYAAEIIDAVQNINLNEDEVKKFLEEGEEFDTKYGWQSTKDISDELADINDGSLLTRLPEDKRERKRLLIQKQKTARHMQRYGQSLQGKMFGVQQETILVDRKQGRAKSTQKISQSSKAKAIIEEKRKKDEEDDRIRARKQWKHLQSTFENDIKNGDYILPISETEKFISDCNSDAVVLKAKLTLIEYCWQMWKQQRISAKTEYYEETVIATHTMDIEGALQYPVKMFTIIQEILHKYKPESQSQLTDKQKRRLAGHVHNLGFTDMAKSILNYPDEEDKRDSVKGPKEVLSSETEPKFRIKISCARFQLHYMGHLLMRDIRHDPDPRITTFIPDTWQRKLLDAVDANESALIIAPTSSGKTFASFYCMRKILKEDNDGVVVYVAPTKALVNQVAAEVTARFKKDLPNGKALCGVFTRDFRTNALNCQILVTVPQTFEILLLSHKHQDWVATVKYVIFDEVHCLGGEIGSEVWEHLLVMIQCPFLALSATVRNPEDLQRWLQESQQYKKEKARQQSRSKRHAHLNSYKVNLVTYHERYSDLEKYVYLPDAPPTLRGLAEPLSSSAKTDTKEFQPLHPAATLSFKQFCNSGFPDDMSFSPRETLQLYDIMVAIYSEIETELPDKLKELEPRTYFKSEHSIITRQLAKAFERDVKKELLEWRGNKKGKEKIARVISRLRTKPVKEIKRCESEWANHTSEYGRVIGCNFIKLIEQLDAQDKLPALVFSFDRTFCEDLCENVTSILEKRERILKEEFYKSDAGKKAKKDSTLHAKMLRRQRDKKEREDESEGCWDDSSPISHDLEKYEEEIRKKCSFASIGHHNQKDLERILHQLRHTKKHPLRNSFKRGIAYHHAGLGNKWKKAVENLFRTRYLKVVVATGTLALGIHMPCKTVIFAGDSVYLDATQYRQMSGRAGRRGFDHVGNVIFFGIPRPKIQRLIMSSVPHLKGNFPISLSLVLRLLLLTSKCDLRSDAEHKALCLLKHPFLRYDQPQMDTQFKHYFLFSVEYLLRMGLLDINCIPQGFAALAARLHYHQPAVYVFLSFLKGHAFHNFFNRRNESYSDEEMRKLVLVLANLFGRKPIVGNLRREYLKKIRSSSVVVLEKLPVEFENILREHNQKAGKTFRLYIENVTNEMYRRALQAKLPFSGLDFPSTNLDEETNDACLPRIVSDLKQTSNEVKAVSIFSALSGLHDPLFNASDVAYMQRLPQEMYMEIGHVPILPHRPMDRRNRTMDLNAYALDFFKHGSSKIIMKENGLESGEVFDSLKDFLLTIKAISVALCELGPEEDGVVRAFKQLATQYEEKFKEEYQNYN
ncbi:probable ATP-dependent RNA helicase DDX60 [Ptychodera flava]|uniref:probable ATP-dependent RNA helicase DDX60 n=1 Tax=Ptychodera flava TaxID=63121 RepID=UPI00396A14F9